MYTRSVYYFVSFGKNVSLLVFSNGEWTSRGQSGQETTSPWNCLSWWCHCKNKRHRLEKPFLSKRWSEGSGTGPRAPGPARGRPTCLVSQRRSPTHPQPSRVVPPWRIQSFLTPQTAAVLSGYSDPVLKILS